MRGGLLCTLLRTLLRYRRLQTPPEIYVPIYSKKMVDCSNLEKKRIFLRCDCMVDPLCGAYAPTPPSPDMVGFAFSKTRFLRDLLRTIEKLFSMHDTNCLYHLHMVQSIHTIYIRCVVAFFYVEVFETSTENI